MQLTSEERITRHVKKFRIGKKFHSRDIAKELGMGTKEVSNVVRFLGIVRNTGRHHLRGTVWERIRETKEKGAMA